MARLVLAMPLSALGLFPRLSWAQDQSAFFYQDRRDPVDIRADNLSVSDQNQTATFSGHVVVTQGAARMQCARFVVHFHYEGPDGHGVIDRFECKPNYVRLDD